jgi:mannosyltransferase
LVAVTLAAGVGLRLVTPSGPWLDQSADIAGVPLAQLAAVLRHAGAPPLYYYVLHFWMQLFGTSDLAVRSLGVLCSVATIPLGWLAGRRIGGLPTAWVTVLLLATSPFALSSESQMYSLVIGFVLLGYVCLARALEVRRPSADRLIALSLISGLLLLTHYWSLYLLTAVGLVLVGKARLVDSDERARYLRTAGALAAGLVLFLPWVPDFAYQSVHTGALWAEPASFSATVDAVSVFAGGGSNAGRALGLTFFALAGLGLLGVALDAWRVKLDLRTRPAGRGVALVTAGTLALAIAVGVVTRGAYTDRYTPLYAAVVFPPFLLLIALGTTVFADRRVKALVVSAATGFGFVACVGFVRQ